MVGSNDIKEIGGTITDPWVLLAHWTKYSGYSRDAFNGKVRSGIWIEGKHWIKSPDGKIHVNWATIQAWKESNYDQQELQQASNL